MKKILTLTLIFLFITASSYSEQVPVNVQARLMLKIISVDLNFDRLGDNIKIGVTSQQFLIAIRSLGNFKIKGKPFTVEKISSINEIHKYNAVYIDAGFQVQYNDLGQKAGKSKILTFCGQAKGVKGPGGAIAFIMLDGKPKILVNLNNAKDQGSDFSDNFLKHAEITN